MQKCKGFAKLLKGVKNFGRNPKFSFFIFLQKHYRSGKTLGRKVKWMK